MKTLRLSTVFLILSVFPFASVWQVRAANESPVPQLLVPDEKDAKKKRPLRMSGLEIDVEVFGQQATTTLTMTFRNELDRVLEGELVFPLGDGESVSRFAMSLETIDKIREGVVVEKDRGRQIFESTVRQKVDPGLLEMTKGNNFRSRVYPIPAKGEKRIIVGFEGTLKETGGKLVYELPLLFKENVDQFKVAARVLVPGADKPSFDGLLEGADGIIAGSLHHAAADYRDFKPAKPLKITLPKPDTKIVRMLVHTEPGRAKGKVIPAPTTYFEATVPVVVEEVKMAAPPKKVQIVWDTSASAGRADHGKVIAAIEAFSAKNPDAELSIRYLGIEAGDPIKLAGAKSISEELKGVHYDGGTRLGSLDLSGADVDLFLLVTDGIGTIGKSEITLSDVPVLALNASKAADHGYLRSVARRTGGQFIDLMATTTEEAVARMQSQTLVFLGVEGGGEVLQDFYPSVGAPVEGGSFKLAGRIKGDAHNLTLKFGINGKVVARQEVSVHAAGNKSKRARRLWAQAKIAELGMQFEKNREEIIAVAKKNSIVTRATSLIVLDTMEDYVRHRVIPPGAMQKEYFEKLELAEVAEEKPKAEHLAQITVKYEELKKWHATEFPGIEAAVLASAQHAVDQAKAALQDSRAIQIIKKKRIRDEVLAPAEALLTKAKALQTEHKELPKADKDAIAEWEKKLAVLGTEIADLSERTEGIAPPIARPNGIGAAGGEAPPESARMPMVEAEENEGASRPRLFERLASRAPDAAPESDAVYDSIAPQEGHPLTAGLRSGASFNYEPAFGDQGGSATPGGAAITLKKWSPNAPYLKALKNAPAKGEYGVYMKLRRENQNSSAFFLDAADYFIEKKQEKTALRVLSNIAEMDLENAPLLRILGHRLLQLGEAELAVEVFAEVLEIRGEEPQSYRDLALATAATGDLNRAAELLWEVVERPWDGRFSDIGLIALNELNALIAKGGEAIVPDGMSQSLQGTMPVELRVVLSWDADNTDVDLWVVDPTGEICKYDHNRTLTGGRMSQDFTGGYGPEEFLIRRALHGKYTVKAHFYGNHQQTLAGATTVQAKVTTGYGTAAEKTQEMTLRLQDENDVVEVGSIEIK